MSNPDYELEGYTPCRECDTLCENDYCSEQCWNESNL